MKELRLDERKMKFAKSLGLPERTGIETLQNFNISLTPYTKGEYSLIVAGEIDNHYFYAEYIQVGDMDDDYFLLDDVSEGFWDNPLEMIKEGLGL
jgi:hypothetical protein|nr:MAG TPA: hypothetical protein [Caudoviricetes sp.]